MNKPWLEHYPAGINPEIQPDEYNSLPDLFLKSCAKFADKPALCHRATQMSYRQLQDLAERFATYLQMQGLKKGDRIALMMPNLLQYPVCLFGSLMAGLVIVNVNPLYTAKELTEQLIDSKPSAIVIFEPFAKTLEVSLKTVDVSHVIVTKFGDLFSSFKGGILNFAIKYVKRMGEPYAINNTAPFKATLKHKQRRKIDFDSDDVAFLQYTGGTTGVAKGAMLTHRNLIANVLQVSMWLSPLFDDGKEVVVAALPLYHIFALMVNGLLCAHIGAMNILITNPRDFSGFIKEIKPFAFTGFLGVNTLFNALLHQKAFRRLNFKGMKLSLGGGMAVQASVAAEWKKMTGHALLEGYGLTEASPVICVNPPLQQEYDGSIGFPLPSTDVKIMKTDDQEASVGEPGELCVKGPQVMLGYWQKEAETKQVLTRDGWLKTGDIATIDETGRVKIVDRKKDVIVISGFNVYPNEVESVLSAIDGVLEVAVIGVADDVKGEIVKAVIVKENDSITREGIISTCRKSLTAYKVPKLIEFVDSLPKSNVGKVLRKELRT